MAVGSVLFNSATVGGIIPFVDVVLRGKKIQIPEGSNLPKVLYEPILKFINYLNSFSQLELLKWLAISVIVLFLFKEIFTFLHSYLIRKLSLLVVRDIRNKIYNKLLNLSLDFYSHSKAGQLVSRITYDAGMVQNAVAEGLRDLIFESIQLLVLITLLVFIVQLYNIPWWLIFVILIVMPSIIYPVIRIGRKLRAISTAAQEKMANINSILYETFSGIRIVKAFDMSEHENDKFKNQNLSFYKIMLKSVKRLAITSPLTEYISIVAGALIIYLGGREIILRGLAPGGFLAFIVLILSMSKPFNKLSGVHIINQQALAAAERIFKILDKESTIKDKDKAGQIDDFESKITFKDVSFNYNKKDEILKDINLEVKKGEIIAIVGRSGVGKTTLVNLIPRFYDVINGKVAIDGYDIRDITISSLRKQIGIVTQETILFNDTVRANIAYGKIDADLNRVKEAARIANAHDFIEKLPYGYETVIGDRGFKLSGGEKQRLAIARAVLKSPPILILDEATSQLDTENERLVQKALDNLMAGRTVFVIAHRLSTVRHASRIIVLDKGVIAELGTHEELTGKDSLYKKLYNLQFRDIVDCNYKCDS